MAADQLLFLCRFEYQYFVLRVPLSLGCLSHSSINGGYCWVVVIPKSFWLVTALLYFSHWTAINLGQGGYEITHLVCLSLYLYINKMSQTYRLISLNFCTKLFWVKRRTDKMLVFVLRKNNSYKFLFHDILLHTSHVSLKDNCTFSEI